ncbi:MAG: hypothetical protein WA615_20790, partial [Bradyrhizobium sp.]|uniref:hypothetical protein n=1 Tax=Bradyrhizobium sp. TaxID=376 RepID=UPI003C7B8887
TANIEIERDYRGRHGCGLAVLLYATCRSNSLEAADRMSMPNSKALRKPLRISLRIEGAE